VKVGGILAIFFSYARGYFLISAYFYKYRHQVFEFYAKDWLRLRSATTTPFRALLNAP
jgi:hypothetical protein